MTQRVVNYTYGTGNPVLPDGSIDVRDGIDNLQSMDVFMNAPEDTYNQRDGDIVRTLAGINNELDSQILNMGFTRIGTFAAGATLTNPRQTLLWDIADGGDGQEYGWSGAFPKIVPASSTPASTGGISVGAWISRFDPELRIQVREALRRSYAEAGYFLADGSFEVGGALAKATDVLLYEAEGKAYSWGGALPKIVPAGSTPTSTGGVGDDAWTQVTSISYKHVIGNENLLVNPNFTMPSPDTSVAIPGVSPRSYAAGSQILLGWFAHETTGVSGLTYSGGEITFTGGGIYQDVPKDGALKYLSALTASVAGFDQIPSTVGVSVESTSTYWRVRLTPASVYSVKLETGAYATRHGVSDDQIPQSVTNREAKLNLHFGTMHGNPFRQTDIGGTVNFNITTSMAAGGLQLTLTSAAGLAANQTIVYLCADGTYKTNVILSVAGAVLNLKKPLQKAVNAGPNLWNFWEDRAHPNQFGFYAIADDAIEELRYVGEVEVTVLPEQLNARAAGDTIALLSNDDPEAPGCLDVKYARVTAVATSGGGATTYPINLTAGMYRVTGVVNPSVNSDISELLIAVVQSRPSIGGAADTSQQVANVRLSVRDCLTYFEFTFYAQDRHYQTLIFEPNAAGVFEIGKCEIVKITNNILSLNAGKHVLYGDSWINRGHIYDRLVYRLPNANIIKKGNSGWASDQLYADFDNQVTPERPDFVWLMCSTNDFFRNYTVDKFSFEMGRIKQKIFDIKANSIGWDSTVGANDDPDSSLAHNLTRSRQYALVTSYRKSNVKYDGGPSKKVRDTININETIAAGAEILVGVFATTAQNVSIVYSAFENKSGAITVKAGFASSVVIPTVNTITWFENSLKRPRDGIVLVSNGTATFPTISLRNTSGASVTVRGTVIAEYYPQR